MSALTLAEGMGRDAVLARIKESGMKNYGLYQEPLADLMERAKGHALDAALNNADTDHALLGLLKTDPESVLEGICIARIASDAPDAKLYLPEDETELMSSLKETAKKFDVTLESGIVDVRKTEDDLWLHLEAALALTDLFEDKFADEVYVAVNDGNLKKVNRDTKISDLASLDKAKAVWMGYRYYTPEEAAELTAGDATTGLVLVLTDKDCIVDRTDSQLVKYRHASCGKCVFCREGLLQLEYEQKEITEGRGKEEYLDLAKEIGEAMEISTLCSVGKESAKAALDATEKFTDEYTQHIKKNVCPAGVCQAFVHIYVDPAKCKGNGDCIDVCPEGSIEGKPRYISMIDEFDCTKCGKCIAACEEGAIVMTAGKLPKLPNRLTRVGRFKRH